MLIVVDSSALVAIAEGEPDAAAYASALARADRAVISPVNATEAAVVLLGRGAVEGRQAFAEWLQALAIEVFADALGYEGALRAYLRFGKGFHPARLNLGDCFAYALAAQLEAPLLFKGEDFAKTDLRSALEPD